MAISRILLFAIGAVIIISGTIGFVAGYNYQQKMNGETVTLSEYVIQEGAAKVSYFVSGTCTGGGGTVNVDFTTTTEYLEATNITGYVSVRITTFTSQAVIFENLTETVSTVSNTLSSYTCPLYG